MTPPTRCIYQVSNWYLTTCTKKVRKTFRWLGALVTPPFKCFVRQRAKNCPTMTKISKDQYIHIITHWQQVEEQAPKPVGWTMCFLLMTLVPVQKLCVNIYVYICVYIPYTSSVIGRIYNGSVIQYWRSCTPSRSIGECAVPDLNAILCFLWFTNCVLLFDNNLILGCLWHCVFV